MDKFGSFWDFFGAKIWKIWKLGGMGWNFERKNLKICAQTLQFLQFLGNFYNFRGLILAAIFSCHSSPNQTEFGIFKKKFKNWRQKWRNFEKNPIFQEFGPFLGQSG